MRRSIILVVVVILLAALTAPLSACSRPAASTSQAPAPTRVALEQMSPDDKRSQLPEQFPLEVPVPVGKITSASKQGGDVWVYTVSVQAAPQDVLAFYEKQYNLREWAEAERSTGGNGTRVLFQKGDAQTSVVVSPDGSGSKAEVAIGIGVPVGQTY